MELRKFLNNISQEGSHWIEFHVMMDEVRKYEKRYGIEIQVIVK
jgi:hypothetical protein